MSTTPPAFPIQIPLGEKILPKDLKLLEASDLGYKYRAILADGGILNVGLSITTTTSTTTRLGPCPLGHHYDPNQRKCVPDKLPSGPDESCLFHPEQDKCKADPNGNCPRGFLLNDDDHCVPDKPCPKGFEQHAEDESGTCYPVTIAPGAATTIITTNSGGSHVTGCELDIIPDESTGQCVPNPDAGSATYTQSPS